MSENEVPLKKCSKCGILQVFDNFHRDRTKADGCATVCKTCVSHKKKQYYVEHKEASNEKDRAPLGIVEVGLVEDGYYPVTVFVPRITNSTNQQKD